MKRLPGQIIFFFMFQIIKKTHKKICKTKKIQMKIINFQNSNDFIIFGKATLKLICM